MDNERSQKIEQYAAWALSHPPSGRKYAGRHLIMKEFGCKNHRAREAVNLARKIAEEQKEVPPDVSQSAVQVMRENQRLKADLQRYGEMEHLFTDIFQELQPALPAYKIGEQQTPKFKTDKQECILMADIGDWQVGLHVRPEDTMHLGGYSFEIFQERLKYFCEKVLIVYEEFVRVRPIKRLIINGVGDLLEGVNIYKGQSWFTDLELQRQLHETVTAVGFFLRDLGKRIPEVTMYAVWGNHGRIGQKGELPPRCNAEYMMLLELQRYIRQLKNVQLFVSKCPLLAYDCMGQIHLLAHGDKTRGWMGIPFYGLSRDTLKYVNLLQLVISCVHYGHHHRRADWSESATELFLNGAMCGPTILSVDDIKAAEIPSQNLFLVHPDHGVSWRVPIKFEKREPMTADANGIYTPVNRPTEVPDLLEGEW